MKKQIKLSKKTIKKLKLQLRPKNDRKVAPMTEVATNGQCDGSKPWYTC